MVKVYLNTHGKQTDFLTEAIRVVSIPSKGLNDLKKELAAIPAQIASAEKRIARLKKTQAIKQKKADDHIERSAKETALIAKRVAGIRKMQHIVDTKADRDLKAMKRWCRIHTGQPHTAYSRWTHFEVNDYGGNMKQTIHRFMFLMPDDAMLFKLTFG